MNRSFARFLPIRASVQRGAACLGTALLLAACSQLPSWSPAPTASPPAPAPTAPTAAAATPPPAAVPAPAPPPAPAPIPVQPLDDALLDAANRLFSSAAATLGAPPAQRLLVIDPLVDAVSYTQSVTTQSMETKIQGLVRSKYPGFSVQPMSRASIGQAPIVLVGTFTAIDLKNQVGGAREAFRICLALADLKTGLIVAKGVARAQVEGVDLTPLRHLQDSPTWAKDPSVDAYVRTCQATKPGDRIDPAYLDGILAASLIAEAATLQDQGRLTEAVDVYRSALATPKGDQLRVHNGIYSASWRLGRRADAEKAFGDAVRVGLETNRLGVKFRLKVRLPEHRRAHQSDGTGTPERAPVGAARRKREEPARTRSAAAEGARHRQWGRFAREARRHRYRRPARRARPPRRVPHRALLSEARGGTPRFPGVHCRGNSNRWPLNRSTAALGRICSTARSAFSRSFSRRMRPSMMTERAPGVVE